LKCSKESIPVARVSHRVSELRGSSASATHAMEAYQGSDQFAAIVHANVSAQVAATTVGTSGDKLVAASELPPVTLHGLRHGAATLAQAAGTDLKVVRDQLGHSTIVLTADIYTSVLPETARTAAEFTAALLFPARHAPVRRGKPAARRLPGAAT
jgi:site-specific recombinase XerC